MIIIGITGSVGTGKTETTKYFKRKRVPIFDSDLEVNLLYKKADVLKAVEEKFPEAFTKNILKKEKLALIVFRDSQKLKILENLIYGFLKHKRNNWIRKQIRERRKLIVLDVPLLFERDKRIKYDKVLVTTCSKKIQANRVLKRKGWNEERLNLIRKKQLSEKKKKVLADVIINSERGKRNTYKIVYNILIKSYNLKCRSFNRILTDFND